MRIWDAQRSGILEVFCHYPCFRFGTILTLLKMAEEAAMKRSSAAQKQRIPSRSVEVKRSKRDASEADLSDRDDDDEKDQGDPGEEDDGDEEVADLAENEDGEEEEEQEEVAESSTSAVRKAKKARTEASASKAKSKRKTPTAGIVYISRLPPGMTPQKVRHLMARWGDVGKVYAQRRDGMSLPVPYPRHISVR